MNDAKTEIHRVRMPPMEKAALLRQANDQHKTMSEYIRSIAKCPPEMTCVVFVGLFLFEYACSEKIAHYIKMRYDHEITDEETAYLAVHIRRIQPEKELEEDSH